MSLPGQASNPTLRWEYFVDEWDQISEALLQHLQLTLTAVAIGVVISALLTAMALRFRWSASPISGLTGVLYTVPSVALFGLLVPYTGLSIWTAVIPLVAVPVAIIGTFAVMSMLGFSLNNLTLFDPRSNSEVKHYCELLGLQPYLDKLRHGVLTEVGGSAAEHLDEGIYQRIAIIRGLLRKPRILLLDHAASGLDLDGIKRLAEVLKSLQGQTTVLLVSHKEQLIESCTRQLAIGNRGLGA